MTYLVPADFRPASFDAACHGLQLTDDEANDARLVDEIATASQLLDDLTSDHYEPQTGVTLDLDVILPSGRLIVPRRIKTITTVKTRDYAGNLTLQAGTAYRVNPSLDSTGTYRLNHEAIDSLDLIPYGTGLAGVTDVWNWPVGPLSVQVIGDFGWTVTPSSAKRFVALLVYDHFKEKRSDLRRASRYTTGEVAVEVFGIETDRPTGIDEADRIVADLRRQPQVMVA